MVEDDEPIPQPGRDLLTAYRDHTGPSPEAVERIAAALRAAEADAPIPLQPHRRWAVAGGVLLAAAIALLALRSSLTQQQTRRDDPAAAINNTNPPTPQSTQPRTSPPLPAPPTAPEPTTTTLPRPPPRPRTESLPDPTPSLAAEMQHMRAAQQALAADDPHTALTNLATYIQAFPDGRLHEEYLALHAIAQCSIDPTNRSEADTFLAAHPRSMFAERVRNACTPPQ